MIGVSQADIVTVDSTGTVGQYSSLEIDPLTGFGVMSYYDVSNTDVKLARCNDAVCSAPTLTTIATDDGKWTSLELQSGTSFPIIAYANNTEVRLAACTDANCSGPITNSLVATAASARDISLQLTSGNLPVISYDTTGPSGTLNVVACTVADCSSGTPAPVVLAGPALNPGFGAALALDSANRPVVSHTVRQPGGPPIVYDLYVTRCTDAACSSFGTNLVEGNVGGNGADRTSIELDSSNFPVISYYDPTPSQASLKVAHCVSVDCSGQANINILDRGTTTGVWSSLKLHPSTGFPLISYFRSGPGNVLALAACEDANCANASISLLDNTVAGSASLASSLALSSMGFPNISYFQANAGAAGSNDLRFYSNQYVVDFGSPQGVEGSNITYTPTLNIPAPVGGLTVSYTTLVRHNDTAVQADFTATSGTVFFAQSTTTATSAINVPILTDALNELVFETFGVVVAPTSPVSDQSVYGINGTWTIVPKVVIVSAPGLSSLNESGGSTDFTLVLSLLPTADVVVDVVSSDLTECTVSPAQLTFTPGNFATGQDVTVTAVDDFIDDGDQICTAVITSSSADVDYNAGDPADVDITIVDNETSEVTVSLPGLSNINENGVNSNTSFSVVLTVIPSADVVIDVTSSDLTECTVSPAQLTFTSANFSTPQNVTITGAIDAIIDGDQPCTAELVMTNGGDANYNAIDPADVGVTVVDVDVPSVELLTNGGFEIQGVTPKDAQDWKAKALSVDNDRRICKPAVVAVGACAFRFRFNGTIVNGNLPRSIRQVLINPAASAGDDLTLSAQVSTNGLTSSARLFVKAISANGKQKLAVNINAGTYAYALIDDTMTLTDTPTKIKVFVQPRSSLGTFFVDEISLLLTPAISPIIAPLPLPAVPDGFRGNN
jgi:hypothetical protein